MILSQYVTPTAVSGSTRDTQFRQGDLDLLAEVLDGSPVTLCHSEHSYQNVQLLGTTYTKWDGPSIRYRDTLPYPDGKSYYGSFFYTSSLTIYSLRAVVVESNKWFRFKDALRELQSEGIRIARERKPEWTYGRVEACLNRRREIVVSYESQGEGPKFDYVTIAV